MPYDRCMKEAANDPKAEKPTIDEWWSDPMAHIRQLAQEEQKILSSKKPYKPFYLSTWFQAALWISLTIWLGMKIFK